MEAIIFLIAFVIFFPIVLLSAFLPVWRNRKITGGIVNYDSFSRKFVFRTEKSRSQVFDALKLRDVSDRMFCSFDPTSDVVSLSDYTSSVRYNVRVDEYDGLSIVRLQQIGMLGGTKPHPLKVNEFILMKLEAEPVPFAEFGF